MFSFCAPIYDSVSCQSIIVSCSDVGFCLIGKTFKINTKKCIVSRIQRAPDFGSVQVPLLCGVTTPTPPHIHTLPHCCFSIVSKRTTQRTFLFPHSKNRTRMHIWRYSVIRERVKCTHSHAYNSPHGAHNPARPLA